MRVVQLFGPIAAALSTSTRPVLAATLILLVAVMTVGDLMLLIWES